MAPAIIIYKQHDGTTTLYHVVSFQVAKSISDTPIIICECCEHEQALGFDPLVLEWKSVQAILPQ